MSVVMWEPNLRAQREALVEAANCGATEMSAEERYIFAAARFLRDFLNDETIDWLRSRITTSRYWYADWHSSGGMFLRSAMRNAGLSEHSELAKAAGIKNLSDVYIECVEVAVDPGIVLEVGDQTAEDYSDEWIGRAASLLLVLGREWEVVSIDEQGNGGIAVKDPNDGRQLLIDGTLLERLCTLGQGVTFFRGDPVVSGLVELAAKFIDGDNPLMDKLMGSGGA